MEGVIPVSEISDKLWLNIFAFIAYQAVIAIVSYVILKKEWWKINIVFNVVAVLVIAYIKLHSGLDIIRTIFIGLGRAFTMIVVEQYIYNKELGSKDSIFRMTFLNVLAFCGELMTWSLLEGGAIKWLLIIAAFVSAVNLVGYLLFERENKLGVVILTYVVLYILAIIVYHKMNGVSFFQYFKYSETMNIGIKLLVVCIVAGISTAICSKGAYDETEDAKGYLLIGCLKSYCLNMTIIFGLILYMTFAVLDAYAAIPAIANGYY